jgi:hypothetical protein
VKRLVVSFAALNFVSDDVTSVGVPLDLHAHAIRKVGARNTPPKTGGIGKQEGLAANDERRVEEIGDVPLLLNLIAIFVAVVIPISVVLIPIIAVINAVSVGIRVA